MKIKKNNVRIDKNTFEWIKHSAELISAVESQGKGNSAFATDYPGEIGIQLTYRCNLRCPHCFQWNDNGLFKNYQNKKDLSVNIIKKIIEETILTKPRLYLWGGEPLLYREWDDLCQILNENPRQSVICTNGILLNKRIDSILKFPISPNLLISIDGLKYEHETIRGENTFNTVIDNIKSIIRKKKENLYNGSITINCVINNYNVGKLYEFAEYCEELGTDALYFCFPWHISKETAENMDFFCKSNFPMFKLRKGSKASWYSYNYHLVPENYTVLINQVKKLESKSWKIAVRFNPNIEMSEINDFLIGQYKPIKGKGKCYAISDRMDVLADGSVSTCKLFPEFTVGKLNDKHVLEIWKGENFNRIREILSKSLMPVCTNCVLLYQNGR